MIEATAWGAQPRFLVRDRDRCYGFGDVAELLLERGFGVTHETIREWEFQFAPLLTEQLRAKRRGRAGVSWYLDEMYAKVGGRWCYLYRAIDHRGDLIDSMLSDRRDKHAARRFLRRLLDVTEAVSAAAVRFTSRSPSNDDSSSRAGVQ